MMYVSKYNSHKIDIFNSITEKEEACTSLTERIDKIGVNAKKYNRACAHCVMAPRTRWKPFWLATQLCQPNDWTGLQNGVEK